MWLSNGQVPFNSVMRSVHTVNFLLNTVAEVVAYKRKSGQEEMLVTSADRFYTADI
jgi:hypothetical protein